MEYRQPIRQSSDQINSEIKEKQKQSCGKEIEGQEQKSRRDHQSSKQPLIIQPYQKVK